MKKKLVLNKKMARTVVELGDADLDLVSGGGGPEPTKSDPCSVAPCPTVDLNTCPLVKKGC